MGFQHGLKLPYTPCVSRVIVIQWFESVTETSHFNLVRVISSTKPTRKWRTLGEELTTEFG